MQTPYGDAAELIKQFLIYQEECEHARMKKMIIRCRKI